MSKCNQCNLITKSYMNHCVRCSYILLGFDKSNCLRCNSFCKSDKEKLLHNMEIHFTKPPHLVNNGCSWCGKVYSGEVISNGLLTCDNCFSSSCDYLETFGNSWKRMELENKLFSSLKI